MSIAGLTGMAWPLSKDNRSTLRYCDVSRSAMRSARSRGGADVPIGTRAGLWHHRGHGERVVPFSSTVARHFHVRGPIIRHGPTARLVWRRPVRRRLPAGARRGRTRVVVQIDRHLTGSGDVLRSGFARASHVRSVARDIRQKNGRCARRATLRPPRRSQRKGHERSMSA
jgi:hypothetical protein